jgi:hypothetical protein
MFYGPFDYPGRRPDGPWHEDETLALLRAWRRGDTLDELSERHHRPVEAIVSRLRDRGEMDAASGGGRPAGFGLATASAGAPSRG